MRVLTWNIWWRFGDWEPRQPAIAAELAAIDADLVFLQEVWAVDGVDQAVQLADATGLNVARTVRLSGDRAGEAQEFGNAVLCRWPLEVVGQIRLPGLDGSPSHRSALLVEVAAPSGRFLAVVTHLAWQYDYSDVRQAQLAAVVGAIRSHLSSPLPVVLGGDLNAVPGSDEIRRLTGEAAPYERGLVFTDAWAAVGEGPGHTWTRDNPHAAEALWPRRRLDYLFVSWPRPKPYLNPLSVRLVGVEPRGGVVPSDHYGVVAELDDRPPFEDP